MKNSNKNQKVLKIYQSKSKCLKEISINKFNCENEISIKNKNTTIFKQKENTGNISFHKITNETIPSYNEILNEMDKMKVDTGSISQRSISTCISSNINKSVDSLAKFNSKTKENNKLIFNSIYGSHRHSFRTKSSSIGQNENNYFLCIDPVESKRDPIFSCLKNNKIYKSNSKEKHFKNKKKIQPHLINDIYHRMLLDEKEEENLFSIEEYSEIQRDINEKMRAVLIDWLVEVHKLFDLIPETLFLAVDIMDKYLSKRFILKHKLQLLGITSLWIACKYLDISVIDLKYCVYVTDNAYTDSEIKHMEKEILFTLNYTITSSSLLKFYDLLSVNFYLSERVYYMGRYILEIFLLDRKINKYKKSLLACSAIYLAMKIVNEDLSYYTLLKSYTEEDEKTFKECAKQILFVLMNIHQLGFKGIFNKYASEEFCEVSKIEITN